ncbi:uncharacterized protein C2845_PM05G09440 [Panicum miliaceum]|uniref:RING-CH-type domain-containing protein n=1 Tax=Panicum miliaceum TaxID=4540 RepID=A0A3L6T493_PANMI|nr:uncharacterized protein C2845_PM05G09440 [Panicum miliaceum]
MWSQRRMILSRRHLHAHTLEHLLVDVVVPTVDTDLPSGRRPPLAVAGQLALPVRSTEAIVKNPFIPSIIPPENQDSCGCEHQPWEQTSTWPCRPACDGEAAMVVIAAAGEARAGRGGERPVAPDGEVVAHVVVDVADGCAAADRERQRPGCRICHLADGDGDGELPQRLSGRLVRLGCGCRGELAAAHRRCAEAWFSVRGNRRCEICGENAVNITPEAAARSSYGSGTTRRWLRTAEACPRRAVASAGASRSATC